ncbi:hypothetical protein F5X99DRAFT_144157 [Biscogniauxia marginata]|nr:hypothetical protein F5X99DRAFT_144157 [Biscogniauxia marginata]
MSLPPTTSPPSMLSLHIQAESLRWAATTTRARSQHPSPPSSFLSSSSSSSSTNTNDYYDDGASLFSHGALTRRSSISSLFSDDAQQQQQLAAAAPPPPLFPWQQGQRDAQPVATYASLDAAVAQSTAAVEALAPRRLVTPGKLYENEEDDDEIIDDVDGVTTATGG